MHIYIVIHNYTLYTIIACSITQHDIYLLLHKNPMKTKTTMIWKQA